MSSSERRLFNADRPLVDIILPVYQSRRQWLNEAAGSVLAQTYPHWHLTIVDDASPDDTLVCVKEMYQEHTERISFIQLEQNRRAAGARMEAVRQTRGDVIAFIDQDDRWCPRKLERQIERLRQKPTVRAVHTDVQHIDSDGDLIPGSADGENVLRASIPYEVLGREALMKQMFLGNSIRLVSSVVLREAFEQVGGFDETLFGGEDWEFWVRFAASGNRIAHLAEPLVERRIHAGNVSSMHHQARTQGALRALDKLVTMYPSLKDLASRRRAEILRGAALHELRVGDGARIRPQIREIIQLTPKDYRGYALWFLSYLGPLQAWLTNAYLNRGRACGTESVDDTSCINRVPD